MRILRALKPILFFRQVSVFLEGAHALVITVCYSVFRLFLENVITVGIESKGELKGESGRMYDVAELGERALN